MSLFSACQRLAVAVIAAGVAIAGTATAIAATSAASKVAVTIAGIDPAGSPVRVAANATSLWGLGKADVGYGINANSRGVYHVKPGTYLVGGYVPDSDGTDSPQTGYALVVQTAVIRAGGTVTLDAVGSKPLSVSLTGVTAQPDGQTASVCVRGGSGKRAWALAFLDSYTAPGEVSYVKPNAGKDLEFVYQGTYLGQSGTSYYLAGSATGLPATPSYSFAPAGLARLAVSSRAGTFAGSSAQLYLAWRYGSANCTTETAFPSPTLQVPWQQTQYVSPGTWTAGVTTDSASFGHVITVSGGRSYAAVYGTAAAGPYTGAPTYGSGQVCTSPDQLYGEPGRDGWQQDVTGTMVLSRPGRRTMRTTFGHPCFRVGHRSGWYTLRETGEHAKPAATETPARLSTKIALTWHFRVPALAVPAYDSTRQLPSDFATFRPAGLDSQNQAVPGSSTTITLHVIKNGGYAVLPPPDYRLASVRAEYSVDGKSWHTAPLASSHGSWTLTVPDPLNGFVSLRAIVTDVKGDRTTETIYRAYAVGNGQPVAG
jgi:hypothetical protein